MNKDAMVSEDRSQQLANRILYLHWTLCLHIYQISLRDFFHSNIFHSNFLSCIQVQSLYVAGHFLQRLCAYVSNKQLYHFVERMRLIMFFFFPFLFHFFFSMLTISVMPVPNAQTTPLIRKIQLQPAP